MEPVKIRDMKEWSSIDIFLFSNGQQYSPPRKYHLRSEELQWWGTTMSYLGRTHYGSGHSSIELYAINGTKISGPLELINGAAYVAVEPPDSFINTGYEDYLLRASRSWEKRLAQKSFNNEALNPDLKCSTDPAVQRNIDDMEISEKISDTGSLKVNSNTIRVPQKTRPTKTFQRLQRKSIASSKQIQKKKSFDTHGAVLNRICAETDKGFPCPKKTLLKRNGSINQKPSPIVRRKLKETTNQELSSYKKHGSIKPESNLKTEAAQNGDISNQDQVGEQQIINVYNNDETDLMSLKNNSGHDPIIDNSIHHNQNDFSDDIEPILDGCKCSPKLDTQKCSTNTLKEINEYEKSGNLPENDCLNNEVENDHKENIPTIRNRKENKSYDTDLNRMSEKQVIDEYVAHMNKGGILFLKLRIKLKDCKTIFNRDKSKNITMSTSLSNLPKTEKTSQVDIDVSFSGDLLKPNDQKYTLDKSLQSLLNKLYSEETDEINRKNPRIIILQCACRDYSDNHKCCACDTNLKCDLDGKEREAPLNPKLNETFTSCECHNESLKDSKDDSAMKNSVIIQLAKDANEDRPSLPKAGINGTCVKDLAQKFENSYRTKNKNNNNKQNSYNTQENKNKRQSVVVTRMNGSPVLEQDAGSQNGYENYENDPNSKGLCSKSTQTDWCNILLEARLHEDDNYTFHLPPLYILKQCNL